MLEEWTCAFVKGGGGKKGGTAGVYLVPDKGRDFIFGKGDQ